ncbi:MAG TPA: hypothetical protein DCE41_20755 [Cytophagales bacterium]|nr:hypothetical protein [Cytophagales bacterium]HAA17254.1 hypothetical protein [Cytophagales bacterium]HAP60501.1 hypothetical protein [Cytophagales bacterium]
MESYMNNFLANKPLLHGLLFQGDQWHTINGGVAQFRFSRKENKEGITLRAHVPTAHQDAYQLTIQGSKLIIQVHLESNEPGPEGFFRIPMHQRIVEIPAGVDITRIDAVHDDNGLRIFLPFVEGWSGEVRPVQIRDTE